MKTVFAIILVLALFLGTNANPRPRQINLRVLEKRLRTFLQPGFRDEFEDNLKRFIDTVVRDLIINGAPDLGLPVLDPLKVDHLDINLSQETLVVAGSVDNVVVTGASNFKVVDVKSDLTTLKNEIDISLDAAKLVGEHYVLEGDLFNGALDIFGEGSFVADLFQLTLKIVLELAVKADQTVEVKNLELDATLGSGKVNFENLLGGGVLGDIANDFISEELPNLVEANKGPILLEVAALIKDIANERLVGITLDDLLDLINNTPKKA